MSPWTKRFHYSATSSSSSSSSHPLSPTESSDKNPKNAISTCLSNLREKWEPLQKKVTFLEALAKSLDPDPLFSPKVKSQLTTILPSLKSPKDLLPSLNAALLAESFSWKDEFLKPLISIQEQIDTILTSLSAPPEGNSTVDTLENIKTFYRSSYHALQQARGRRLLGCSGHPTRGGGYSRSGGGEVKQ